MNKDDGFRGMKMTREPRHTAVFVVKKQSDFSEEMTNSIFDLQYYFSATLQYIFNSREISIIHIVYFILQSSITSGIL